MDYNNIRVAIYDIESHLIGPYGPKETYDIYCIAVKVVDKGVPQDTLIFTNYPMANIDGSLKDGLDLINSCDIRVGHNICNYDDPACEAVGAIFTNKPLDTLICTQIMYTPDELYSMDIGIREMPKDLYMSYSLKAFGIRLGGQNKLEFDDFSQISDDMLVYCKADVEVTYNLYKHIVNSDRLPTDELISLENTVGSIIVEQEYNGFYFDIEAARKLALELSLEQQSIERKLSKVYRPRFLPDGPPKSTNKLIKRKMYSLDTSYIGWTYYTPYRKPLQKFKSGKIKLPAKTKYKWFSEPHYMYYQEKDGEYQDIKLTKFKATDNQIIIWLDYLYSFKFETYTQKGNIRVERDHLDQLGEELQKLAEDPSHQTYLSLDLARFHQQSKETQLLEAECLLSLKRLMKLKKDLSQLAGGDKALLSVVRDNSTITTRINQNGTVTGRFTSSGGGRGCNLNQIPSSEEFRALFTAPIMVQLPDNVYQQLKEYNDTSPTIQ